ncbi:hypothetical protein C0V75_09660 [Tabrizicola sp. TH137]|uniref:phosphotransferase n=1 Tax=Tabrizicola sp. TH137 TaxID=2067452 RepID=UPI000C7A9C39|nr:phosphotransferase [Tabrizicola sp. TH137]PLL13613.1 hypothetical protein C0V75_09660 [Tabrizicola sp. TH137]
MTLLTPFPLVKRYALLGHCEGAALLAEADARIASDPAAQRLLARPGARVTSDLQTRLREGRLRIKSVLWTVQVPQRPSPGLAARSLSVAPDAAQWFNLEDDPALPFGQMLRQPETHVLRYVPGRRATLRLLRDGLPIIQKIKKKERLAEARSRHLLVEAAVENASLPIPGMLMPGTDYCLRCCPGVPMEAATTTADRLAELGRIVARLHGCAMPGLPPADLPEDPLPWLATALPGLAARWQHLGEALAGEAHRPDALCHGDLCLSQVLLHQDGTADHLTLLDFDRAGAGSAAADLATLLCSLPDLGPDRHFAAEAAVLEGYSSIRAVPSGLGAACARAEMDLLRHHIRKGTAPTRQIMAGLSRAEAALVA